MPAQLHVFFMVLQAAWYEQYRHAKNHDTYTRWKYAFSTSTGVPGLLAFVVGIFWLGHIVFWTQ
jgi:hypothetical protein